jgi:hypothetical protein
MSQLFEPRVVEKPVLRRWLWTALKLVGRSPVRFGIVIALLGWLDGTGLQLLQGLVIHKIWIECLGMLFLPFIWVFVCVMARAADDRTQTWSVLAGLGCSRFWTSILVAVFLMAAPQLTIILIWGDEPRFQSYINGSGELLFTFGAQSAWVYVMFGACFIPLLVREPALPMMDAQRLSMGAMEINGPLLVERLVVTMGLISIPLHFSPSFGITDSAYVVYAGVLNYVAYRDIFERRSENLPQVSHAKQPLLQKAPETARRWSHTSVNRLLLRGGFVHSAVRFRVPRGPGRRGRAPST